MRPTEGRGRERERGAVSRGLRRYVTCACRHSSDRCVKSRRTRAEEPPAALKPPVLTAGTCGVS
eukprot:1232406-Prymnesium_polylepis.1